MPTPRKTSRSKAKSPAVRMAAYRARMRARGLKPVVLWLPDVSSESRRADIARQCKELAASYAKNDELQDFIDAIADWPED